MACPLIWLRWSLLSRRYAKHLGISGILILEGTRIIVPLEEHMGLDLYETGQKSSEGCIGIRPV
jgi:hypothetical protein